jgi:hypothetical protein
MSGQLVKLKIEAYKDKKYSQSDKVDTFEVMFNPDTYSRTWENQYYPIEPAGSSVNEERFNVKKPSDFTLKFIMDGTGAGAVSSMKGKSSAPVDIDSEIKRFRKLTCDYHGEIHRPLYCKISWGTLIFYCILKKVTISYTMFKPNGDPLRAIVDAIFSENLDPALQKAISKSSSPDLTHYRVVKLGDSLPGMSFRIYGDMSYYPLVAEYNNLRNFRKLMPGTKIAFPPLVELEREDT